MKYKSEGNFTTRMIADPLNPGTTIEERLVTVGEDQTNYFYADYLYRYRVVEDSSGNYEYMPNALQDIEKNVAKAKSFMLDGIGNNEDYERILLEKTKKKAAANYAILSRELDDKIALDPENESSLRADYELRLKVAEMLTDKKTQNYGMFNHEITPESRKKWETWKKKIEQKFKDKEISEEEYKNWRARHVEDTPKQEWWDDLNYTYKLQDITREEILAELGIEDPRDRKAEAKNKDRVQTLMSKITIGGKASYSIS